MKYKKLRYNVIIFGLVAIIGCCVAFPLITGSSKNDINQGAIDDPSIVEPEIPDEPVEPSDPEDPEDSEDGDEEEESFEYYNDYDLINYSVNMLYNGKGYSSTISQTCLNTAGIGGITLTVPQYSKGRIVRSGNVSLQEEYLWSTYKGIKDDQCKNYYTFYYIDKNNDKFIEGNTKDYDPNKMTHNSSSISTINMTYSEGMNKWMVMYGDAFPLKTTKGTTTQVYHSDKKGYRTIEVNYNVDKVPSKVKQFFGATGQMTKINYLSLKVVYKINLKTGKMYSITRTEKLTAIAAGCADETTAVTTQVFRSVDKEQDIKLPF